MAPESEGDRSLARGDEDAEPVEIERKRVQTVRRPTAKVRFVDQQNRRCRRRDPDLERLRMFGHADHSGARRRASIIQSLRTNGAEMLVE